MDGFRKDKMEQAILYFCERINNVYLGKTKLMKLLYYLDFDHMEQYGSPVTCGTYRKLPHGPVPMEALDLLKAMAVEKLIKATVVIGPGGYRQTRYLSASGCDRRAFSSTEWDTLEKVASRWEDATAEHISGASHAEIPWKATKDGQEINYKLALYRTPDEEESTDPALKKLLAHKPVREGIRAFARSIRKASAGAAGCPA